MQELEPSRNQRLAAAFYPAFQTGLVRFLNAEPKHAPGPKKKISSLQKVQRLEKIKLWDIPPFWIHIMKPALFGKGKPSKEMIQKARLFLAQEEQILAQFESFSQCFEELGPAKARTHLKWLVSIVSWVLIPSLVIADGPAELAIQWMQTIRERVELYPTLFDEEGSKDRRLVLFSLSYNFSFFIYSWKVKENKQFKARRYRGVQNLVNI